MIRLTLALMALLAAPLSAQNLPALYNVTGVSADDSLNVRSAPATSGDVIGKLAANQTGIEVVQTSKDGKWAQINIGETSGWTALRYLTANKAASFPPVSATCFGTEPFWTLSISESALTLETPDGSQSHAITTRQTSQNRTDRSVIRTNAISATLAGQICNDGMTDRQFGLSVDILSDQGLLSGCCTLAN